MPPKLPPDRDFVGHAAIDEFVTRLAAATVAQRREIARRLWNPAKGAEYATAMRTMATIFHGGRWSRLQSRVDQAVKRWADGEGDTGSPFVDAPAWHSRQLDKWYQLGGYFKGMTRAHAVLAAIAMAERESVEQSVVSAMLEPFTHIVESKPAPLLEHEAPGIVPADRALAERLVAHLARERAAAWDVPAAALMRVMRQSESDIERAMRELLDVIHRRGVVEEADRWAARATEAVASHQWRPLPDAVDISLTYPGTSVPMPIVLEAMLAVQGCLMRTALSRKTFDECIGPFADWYAREGA